MHIREGHCIYTPENYIAASRVRGTPVKLTDLLVLSVLTTSPSYNHVFFLCREYLHHTGVYLSNWCLHI
jgi:hypothetical protein